MPSTGYVTGASRTKMNDGSCIVARKLEFDNLHLVATHPDDLKELRTAQA